MQGFFTLSAEPTEDLGLDQLEDDGSDGSDDESPLALDQTLSSSSDDEDEDASDEEMEESDDQNPDSERSDDEADEDDDDGYLTANVSKGNITIYAANFNKFAKQLGLDQFPVP
jgi:hypothetical protein